MSTTMEKLDGNRVKLRIEHDAEAFEAEIEKAYRKMRGRFNVPGFRKGKAPRKRIELLYGEGVFFEDAFDAVFPDLYADAIREHDLQPVGQPEIDIETIGHGKSLVVLAEVYVRPEVVLGEYKGLDVKRGDDSIDPEAVDQEIGRVRERNAREEEVTDRPAQDDDIVTIDYAGTVDGVAFEGGTAENQPLTLGSGSFIPGFEEQVVGMEIGSERDISVTFPEKYHAEELAGKAAVFHVKLHAIKTRELPDLDDEFAKDVSAFDTLDEYRADIKAKLEDEAKKRVDAAFENALVEAAVENASFDVPPPMIDDQVETRLREMAQSMAYRGISMENYYKYTGQTEEALRESFRPDAEKRVRGMLVLDAIQKAEGIEADDEAVDALIARYAAERGEEPEALRETLTERQLEYLREDATTQAVIDFLKANAK